MSKSAKAWREEGNQYFKKKDHPNALKCYTQSVFVATQSCDKSGDLALAYANRSATLYHMKKYKESLQDIDLAFEKNYSGQHEYSLRQRKALCLLYTGHEKEGSVGLIHTDLLMEADPNVSLEKRKAFRDEQERHVDYFRSIPSLTPEEDPQDADDLGSDKSMKIEGANKAVSLQYNEIKGRHLVANKAIQPGTVVIQGKPYASILLPQHQLSHCHYCYRQLVAPVPCSKCVKALYCRKLCLDEAWKAHHSIECSHWSLLSEVGIFPWLSLRILMAAKNEGADFHDEPGTMEDVDSSGKSIVPGCHADGSYKSTYHAVYSLMAHTNNHTQKQLATYQQKASQLARCFGRHLLPSVDKCQTKCQKQDMKHLKTATEALSFDEKRGLKVLNKVVDDFFLDEKSKVKKDVKPFSSLDHVTHCSSCNVTDRNNTSQKPCRRKVESKQAFDSLDQLDNLIARLVYHMQQLKCNAHAITAVKTVSDEDSGGDEDTRGRFVSTTEQVRLATAVYPTASLMNHGCEPNVIASFEGRQLTVRAIRNIKKDEEVLHCYGPHAKHMDKSARQKALQEQYYFTCQCSACEYATTDVTAKRDCDWSRAYRCSQCGEPVYISQTGHTKCGECGNAIDEQRLKELEHRGSTLFKIALHHLEHDHFDKCLKTLNQCLEIRTRVLYKYHKDIAETQDCMAKFYASLGGFTQAAIHLELSFTIIEKIYGEDSIEAANELYKMAQIYFNGRQIKKAKTTIDRTIKLFTMHYGKSHDSLEELYEMQTCLNELPNDEL